MIGYILRTFVSIFSEAATFQRLSLLCNLKVHESHTREGLSSTSFVCIPIPLDSICVKRKFASGKISESQIRQDNVNQFEGSET